MSKRDKINSIWLLKLRKQILSRVLVTLDEGLARWVDLLDIHQVELQLVVTRSYCNCNTS
jgi:hypothetical protein